jgi:hypothetical protein
MRKRLLAVQGPFQFIAGLIAMEWYAKTYHDDDKFDTILVIYDLLADKNVELNMVGAITKLASFESFSSIVFIDSNNMNEIVNGFYSDSIKKLKKFINETDFDEIFIARDYCGDGSPLIINAYPSASRITYGDAFGLVGNEHVFNMFNWRSPVRSALSRYKQIFRHIIFGRSKKFRFDTAVLALPFDMSGVYLNDIPLLIPERSFVIERFLSVCGHMSELNLYCEELLKAGTEGNNYLFLLSNLSASGFISIDNEILLYIQLIENTAKKNSTVFIKAHPRSNNIIFDKVVKFLSENYKVVAIDDNRFSGFPIELWVKLIDGCNVVPIFSSSSLNIKYVFNGNVIITLNSRIIKEIFYKDKVFECRVDNNAIFKSLLRLNNWDGKTVLYKGSL